MTSPEVEVADAVDLVSRSSDETREDGRHCGCRRKCIWFLVEPVLTVYCFSEFPLMIISQKYTLDWITVNVFNESHSRGTWPPAGSAPSPCDPNITDHQRQMTDKVQSMTSLFTVAVSIVWGIPAIIVTVILGAGSDRFGRRFAILPPLLGVVLNSAVAYAVILTDSSILFFFIGNFLYGCCGSFCAMTMSCFAYVADRTPAERRMLRITLLQLCMLASGIVSPIAIGPLVQLIDVANVLLIVVCVSAFNLAYVFLFLHDDDHHQKLDDERRVNQSSDRHSEDRASLMRSDNRRSTAA